jgi:hypothetical protein
MVAMMADPLVYLLDVCLADEKVGMKVVLKVLKMAVQKVYRMVVSWVVC